MARSTSPTSQWPRARLFSATARPSVQPAWSARSTARVLRRTDSATAPVVIVTMPSCNSAMAWSTSPQPAQAAAAPASAMASQALASRRSTKK